MIKDGAWVHTTFYSKKLSQFISEQRQTFSSAALSKLTLAVPVLISDSWHPEQATAGVHASYRQSLYATRLVPQLLSAPVKRTRLPAQRCIHLTAIDLVLVTRCPLPHRKVASRFVAGTDGGRPTSFVGRGRHEVPRLCSSTGPHSTP